MAVMVLSLERTKPEVLIITRPPLELAESALGQLSGLLSPQIASQKAH